MRRFVQLFQEIDETQSTNEKVSYIHQYFQTAKPEDAAWALFFLCGHRLKRLIRTSILLEWCHDIITLPEWLVEESRDAVGDTAETITLLLPRKFGGTKKEHSLSEFMENIIKPLQGMNLESQKKIITSLWSELSTKEVFILNKILTGSFRLGVSGLLTIKALSQTLDISRELLSQRLMGSWEPTGAFFISLSSESDLQHLNPYPFYLAYQLDKELPTLGLHSDWIVEWKWDGIRAQAVIRHGKSALWSRGNELISLQFPELIEAFSTIPKGTVLDGEILAFANEFPLPFGELQKRLGRKNVSNSMIAAIPIVFMVYDILEFEGNDIRSLSLSERRELLKSLIFESPRILISQEVLGEHWEDLMNFRSQSRERGAEGLMLKQRGSVYGVGRQKGFWWKYKVDPMTIDAVLLYAQAGSGRRANLFTDYTFGVWNGDGLVPIAKAYSGLDQKEIAELDTWVRKNTMEKFGPVRKVPAVQVFEIAFENIQVSKRHKSGLALRFPRILRWRKDKLPVDCDSLEIIVRTYFKE